MGVLDWFGKRGTEVHEQDEYEVKNIGNIVVPEKLTDKNAFILANSISELYFPIDFYADRISKLRFFIADKSGNEIENTELNRFVSDDINPLFLFSEMIYNYVFSLLADGNVINKLGVPSSYKGKPSSSNISRWDVLQPNLVTITENQNVSMLNISDWGEMIKRIYYDEGSYLRKELNAANIVINNYGLIRRKTSNILSVTPLWNANKSIDTLLSVYSARYNIYANNGAAGYLSKKVAGSNNAAFDSAILGSGARDQMLSDINNRNGITGNRNIWGVSGVPLEFVSTLATIKDLMPFEETLEDSIKIAAVLQIPPVLVPRKDQSTYDNQENAEQNVWENGLLSMAQNVCRNLTMMFRIDKTGNKIMFDASNVSALVQNETENEQLKQLKLNNLQLMQGLDTELSIKEKVKEIYDGN